MISVGNKPRITFSERSQSKPVAKRPSTASAIIQSDSDLAKNIVKPSRKSRIQKIAIPPKVEEIPLPPTTASQMKISDSDLPKNIVKPPPKAEIIEAPKKKELTEDEKKKRKEYYNKKRREKVHIDYLKKRLPIEEAKVKRYKEEIASYEKTDDEFFGDESVPEEKEEPDFEKMTETIPTSELEPPNSLSFKAYPLSHLGMFPPPAFIHQTKGIKAIPKKPVSKVVEIEDDVDEDEGFPDDEEFEVAINLDYGID
jgi:hypothetical protein